MWSGFSHQETNRETCEGETSRHIQPCQIYYNLYNILYGTERHTISIKVEKIYYIMSYFDLYYKSI